LPDDVRLFAPGHAVRSRISAAEIEPQKLVDLAMVAAIIGLICLVGAGLHQQSTKKMENSE